MSNILAKQNPVVIGTLAGLSAVGIWATYIAFAKAGVDTGLKPQDFVFLRFSVAGLIMLPWLMRSGISDLGGLGWRRGGALALLAGPLFILLGVGGYAFAPLAHGAVVQPAMIALSSLIGAAVFFGERITLAKLLGAAILIAGLVLIASHGGMRTSGASLIGDGMFVAAGLLWSAFTLLLRKWQISGPQATAAVSVLSALIVMPAFLVFSDTARLAALPLATLVTQVVVQGLLSGVVAVLAFALSVRLLGSARAGLFPALVPGATLLVGLPITGHVPTLTEWTGVALAMLGLLTAIGLFAAIPRLLTRAAAAVTTRPRPLKA